MKTVLLLLSACTFVLGLVLLVMSSNYYHGIVALLIAIVLVCGWQLMESEDEKNALRQEIIMRSMSVRPVIRVRI